MARGTRVNAASVLALNGIRRGIRNRTVILLGVVGPLVLGGLLALAFGGSGPSVHIGLVNLDDSGLSIGVVTGLTKAFGPDGEDTVVLDADLGARSVDDVREQVDLGQVEAAVVIPEGYGRSVTAVAAGDGNAGSGRESPEPLVVVSSSDNPVSSGVAAGIARSVTEETDLRRAVAEGLAGAGRDPGAAMSDGLRPVVRTEPAQFSGDFDAPLFLGPLAVFLFLGLSVSAKSFLRDDQAGILDRVRSAPLSTWTLVAGSAASVVVIGAVAATLVVVLSTVVFGASWGNPTDVAVILTAFVVSVAGLLGLVSGIASTEAQADSWTNLMAFGFAIIGGSFFGGALLPGVLGFIGTLTPNGAAMVALLDAGPGGQGLGGVWPLVVWMLALGVAGVLFGGAMLKRRLQ